ncbi:MAG: DUF1684 domain-containing protein [Verrucomicrobia bacterium]|nr:DUF1684 domain-containing protein [Verrucomicrobiota bacterium]
MKPPSRIPSNVAAGSFVAATWPLRALLGLLGLLAMIPGCTSGPGMAASEAEEADWARWRAVRLESVAGTDGWASLVGLHWLPEGASTSGSRPDQALVFPAGRAPGVVGVWHRRGGEVRFEPSPGVPVLRNGQPFDGGPVATDARGARPDTLSVGGLRISVIDRDGRLGLRVRDSLAPTRTGFTGLPCFGWSRRWVVPARLEPAAPGATLGLATVIGTRESLPLAGTLVFELEGATHRLQAAVDTETDDLFVLFGDTTNGRGTYAAGRFLHAPKPDGSDWTTLDFNRAYNPPCAFTPFATCPRTPPGNHLPLAVRAGERRYRHPAGH